MGFIQEARAEKAIEALKGLSTNYAKIIRDGNILKIDTKDLVPGDIIILESGDKIPADARLIDTVNLEISEAILTGESNPVKKITTKINTKKVQLADRKNMIYKDTTVLYGRGEAVVIATGKNTQIGKISTLLQTQEKDETPLGEQLNAVGKKLSLLAGIIIISMLLAGLITQHISMTEAFFTSISLAVAAIPEGLPAIVTVVLAIGVSRLAYHKAIVRRLNAVETLGSTNYILTDKTGTLTKNQMTVTDITTKDNTYAVSLDNNYTDKKGNIINPKQNEMLRWLLTTALLCNDAQRCENIENCKYTGDPTEVALLEAAENAGIEISATRSIYQRLYEIPFSSETKRMVVVVKHPTDDTKTWVLAKGAPEIIETMLTKDGKVLTDATEQYVKEGLRSLAFAYKELTKKDLNRAKKSKKPESILATKLTFLGVLAQKDPIRPEVKHAILKAKDAGINTLVLTGDHKLTATNIAMELGLINSAEEVIDGNILGDAQGKKLQQILDTVKVFARVSPEQKLKITKAIKERDMIVAVTGDGVNDAPAIKAADIGIAMGITGTDVSKEVADIVLEDDNYATIVEAIRQGRIVYDNLLKFIKYLISCNMSEVFVIAACIFTGLPLPLLPIHILWINLITDGLPALALGMEPGERDIMQRKPRNSHENLLSKQKWTNMTYEGLLITGATLTAFGIGLKTSLIAAQTLTLTTLALAQLGNAFNNRSERHSIFSKDLKTNKYLAYTIIASIFIQLFIVYSPLGNLYLKTVILEPKLILAAFTLALVPLVGVEIRKIIKTRKQLKWI